MNKSKPYVDRISELKERIEELEGSLDEWIADYRSLEGEERKLRRENKRLKDEREDSIEAMQVAIRQLKKANDENQRLRAALIKVKNYCLPDAYDARDHPKWALYLSTIVRKALEQDDEQEGE